MTSTTLIKGGYLLTMDDALGDLANADILISDDVIVKIGQNLDAPSAEVIDATGCIVLPGFVDGHRHLWQTFLRGMLPNCTLPSYMRDMLFQVSPHVTPEDGYVGTMLGALECLNAGITTVLDWSHGLATPADSDARIAGLRASRIRAYYAPNGPSSADWYSWTEPQMHSDIRRLRSEVFADNEGLVRLAAGLRSPGQVPEEVIEADWQMARELELLITIHAGTRLVGRRGLEVDALNRLGLLGADVHFSHGNEFSDEELRLAAAAGATISMSPHAELAAGLGLVKPLRMIESGIKVGLSADGTSMAPGDMFSAMRMAFCAGRSEYLPTDPTEEYEPTMQARDALRMATIDGAAAIGLDHVCGSLSVGKQADVVLVRGDAINTAPVVDPVGTVVISAETVNVDTVLVAGVAVKRHGILQDIDLPGVIEQGRRSRDRVLTAANWPLSSHLL